jgi:hypothetical protein
VLHRRGGAGARAPQAPARIWRCVASPFASAQRSRGCITQCPAQRARGARRRSCCRLPP